MKPTLSRAFPPLTWRILVAAHRLDLADPDTAIDELRVRLVMSGTTNWRPVLEPGVMCGTTPSPITTEQPEPGGVNWMTRLPGPGVKS